MNKRHYEHTLPNIRGSLSNTYVKTNLSEHWGTFLTTTKIQLLITPPGGLSTRPAI